MSKHYIEGQWMTEYYCPVTRQGGWTPIHQRHEFLYLFGYTYRNRQYCTSCQTILVYEEGGDYVAWPEVISCYWCHEGPWR